MNGRLNRRKPGRQTNIHTLGKTSVYHLFVNLELLQRIKCYFSVFNVLDLINKYCTTIQMRVKCLRKPSQESRKVKQLEQAPRTNEILLRPDLASARPFITSINEALSFDLFSSTNNNFLLTHLYRIMDTVSLAMRHVIYAECPNYNSLNLFCAQSKYR